MSEIQMQSIIQDVPNLSLENRIAVGKIIYRHAPEKIFIKVDGARCILNNLSSDVINEIYNFMQNKSHS